MAKEIKKLEKKKSDLAPWRPFPEMARWERDIDQMFENFLGRRLRTFWPERWWPAATEISTPAVDLYEEKDDIVVKAELPGMEKDNIEVNLTDNRLTIKGEKNKNKKSTKKTTIDRSAPMVRSSAL
ncbi:MAG TPA: Hsp20/alpha crystallin family protein [Candidatus Udaeobacter sp.]|jgi:HSP20 family protein|nr:Hsp20/alpha crystallin family protein [Candidatus Udaeobacter sp.]